MKFLLFLTLAFAAAVAFGQNLEVLSVNDGAYPEITVRVRLYDSPGDSFSVTEQDIPVQCSVEEIANPSFQERMFVFLTENSYYFYENDIYSEIKKSLSEISRSLPENSNMNVLFFGHRGSCLRYLSAEQTRDFKLLNRCIDDYFLPQEDSSYIENNVYSSIEEASDYCWGHGKNNAVILTVITRALNLSEIKNFSRYFLESVKNTGVYVNVLAYNGESYNARHELENLAGITGGSFSLFKNDLEEKLAQTIEKSGKAKARFSFREYVVKFSASQKGVSNAFVLKCGSLQKLCEYSDPDKKVLWHKYPAVAALIISLLLILCALVMYYKTRQKIIRRIDSSTQTHIREIQRENKNLKRELDKMRKHPDSVLTNFEKFDIEKNLVGPGKIIPRLLVQDGDKKMVFELGKMIMTIGRKDTNDIVIENRTVSSNHAALSFEGGLFYITDNNSTNGTFINDMRITKGKICPDDIVRLGSVFAKINY